MNVGPILSAGQQQTLAAERALLNDIRAALLRSGGDDAAVAEFGQSIAQLDELFLLVVVGEFNSGKSAFINALLGRQILLEGVTPTTAEINVLTFGPAETDEVHPGRTRLLTAPVDLLRDIHIVDTPGTNAVIREHEVLTTHFVPRADLVLFITSVDRPFSESERRFLEGIRSWGKKVVVVVNKQDLLERPEDLEKVQHFVAVNAEHVLGAAPAIFPVSARLAMRAKQGQPDLWAASGFEPLERFIRETLDDAGRLRLKLLNPIGVARHLVEGRQSAVAERLDLLGADCATLDDVDRQLAQYERDLARDIAPRVAAIDNVLLEMDRRGQAFFDETMRISRITDLLNKSRMQERFEREVVGDAPAVIERRVDDLIDWLVDADLRQWQAVTTHLASPRAAYRDRIVGGGGGDGDGFRADRARLIQSVGAEAQRVVDTYDKGAEARALAESARNAVAAAAATGVGAVGLGAVVTMAATTAAADVTGLVMAGVVGAIGFFIIPNRRRLAKRDMREKIAVMRTRLSTAIREQFDTETARGVQRIRDSIAPYSRFVRAEGEKLAAAKSELDRHLGALEVLLARVEAMG